MTAVFPIACYRPDIVQIAQSVFDTMLGMQVTPLDAPQEGPPHVFSAAVYYAGAWKGALLLECSTEQARQWAMRLMSLDEPPKLDDDARDCLGELANMLAGNLKPLLPGGVGLSIPSVVEGRDYSLRICGGGNLFERLDFADETGPFRITLVEVAGHVA